VGTTPLKPKDGLNGPPIRVYNTGLVIGTMRGTDGAGTLGNGTTLRFNGVTCAWKEKPSAAWLRKDADPKRRLVRAKASERYPSVLSRSSMGVIPSGRCEKIEK